MPTIFKSMRLPFLVLAPICILLGVASVHHARLNYIPLDLLLIFCGGIAAHISVNSFNEYLDFRSGLDAITVKTPFSGGSGGLIEDPQAAPAVFRTAMLSLLLTTLVGLYFIFNRGMLILPIGLLGLMIILSYTQWLNRHPFLCLIAPGLAFGPLMVLGSYVSLTGEYSGYPLLLSIIPFFLVNNLLLLNQLPDIEADKTVGRNHFAIAFGVDKSLLLYLVNALLAGFSILIFVVLEKLPVIALGAILPIVASYSIYRGLQHFFLNGRDVGVIGMSPFLAFNVIITLLVPVILSISLLLN